MRRFLRKPAGVKTREFVARVNEMNNFIREFPSPNGKPAMALHEDEILNLLEFGVPNSWQKQFLMHQFDPQAQTIMEFVEFCKRIKATEEPNEGRKNNKAQDEDIQKSKCKFNDEAKGNSKFCLVHGRRHDSNKCKLLGAKAKRLKCALDEKNNNKRIWRKRIEEGHFFARRDQRHSRTRAGGD